MSISQTESDELQARAQLLVAERDRLANLVLDEGRSLTKEEMADLVLLNHSIDALVNAIKHQNPGPQSLPAPPMPPNRSDPGSDYRVVAQAEFDMNKEGYRTTSILLADYGKWLVATIAAAHLGGIYFIGSIEELSLKAKEPALWALTIGLTLIFACGLATFYNWQSNAAFYGRRISPQYLVDPSARPGADATHLKAIQVTYWVSLALGIASAACVLVSAKLLSSAAILPLP